MSRQTDTAYKYIKEKILNGNYMPSQKLIESQLAEVIGVSRNTVKKALLKLEQENLVSLENNKGATIKSFTLEEVMNFLEIREVLEGLVGRSVAKTISDAELARLANILQEMDIRLKENKFDEYSLFNKEFHGVIYQAALNYQAVELIKMIRTQLIRYQFRTILVPGRTQNSYREHQRIYEALKEHNEIEAAAAIQSHVANVRQTIKLNYQYLI